MKRRIGAAQGPRDPVTDRGAGQPALDQDGEWIAAMACRVSVETGLIFPASQYLRRTPRGGGHDRISDMVALAIANRARYGRVVVAISGAGCLYPRLFRCPSTTMVSQILLFRAFSMS